MCTVYMEETTTLLQVIKRALVKGNRYLSIEGDNMLVINSTRKWNIPWVLDDLIKDICFLLQNFDRWEVRHTNREANQVEDWATSVGHLVDSSMVITNQHYSRLSEILYYVTSGMIFVRKTS